MARASVYLYETYLVVSVVRLYYKYSNTKKWWGRFALADASSVAIVTSGLIPPARGTERRGLSFLNVPRQRMMHQGNISKFVNSTRYAAQIEALQRLNLYLLQKLKWPPKNEGSQRRFLVPSLELIPNGFRANKS